MPDCHPPRPPYLYAGERLPEHENVVDFTNYYDSYPDDEQFWCSVCGSMFYADKKGKDPEWHTPTGVKTL